MSKNVTNPLLFLSLIFVFTAFSHTVLASQDPTGSLREEIAASPSSAPAAIARLLRSAGTQAATLAGPATSAAIESLGSKADVRRISSIVFAAVRATPDNVLEIVRAAVIAAPRAASEIAASAASAVPDPWKEVRYHRKAALGAQLAVSPVPMRHPERGERDFKGEPDFKDAVDAANKGENQPRDNPYDPADPGVPMTLAEAIAQTAFDSQTGIGLAAIEIAIDGALIGDPGALMNKVAGPRGISGVGDAGSSNFANEPLDPGLRRTRVNNAPVKPQAPAVSQ